MHYSCFHILFITQPEREYCKQVKDKERDEGQGGRPNYGKMRNAESKMRNPKMRKSLRNGGLNAECGKDSLHGRS